MDVTDKITALSVPNEQSLYLRVSRSGHSSQMLARKSFVSGVGPNASCKPPRLDVRRWRDETCGEVTLDREYDNNGRHTAGADADVN